MNSTDSLKNKFSYGLRDEDYNFIGISRQPDDLVFITITEQVAENESYTVSIKFPFEELKRVVDLLSVAKAE